MAIVNFKFKPKAKITYVNESGDRVECNICFVEYFNNNKYYYIYTQMIKGSPIKGYKTILKKRLVELYLNS